MRPLQYWIFCLGILFISTINWNGVSNSSSTILYTLNDTATYFFNPRFDRTYHYHYKSEHKVKTDCFMPDSIRFVNKKKNTSNRIVITLKYK